MYETALDLVHSKGSEKGNRYCCPGKACPMSNEYTYARGQKLGTGDWKRDRAGNKPRLRHVFCRYLLCSETSATNL